MVQCRADFGLPFCSVGLLLRLLISLQWVLLQVLQHRRQLNRHQYQQQEICVLHEHPVTLAATATTAVTTVAAPPLAAAPTLATAALAAAALAAAASALRLHA